MRFATSTLPCHCPSLTGIAEWATKKRLWIRINRLLAWVVVLSPLVQIILGTDFWRGLWIDLVLLAMHGALSLVLFGMPRTRSADHWMLWLGLAPAGLSPRSTFLMSGWRIALAAAYAAALPLLPVVMLVLFAPVVLLWVLLPFTVLRHLHNAAEYAFKRWGMTSEGDAWVAAFCATAACAIANTVNLFR